MRYITLNHPNGFGINNDDLAFIVIEDGGAVSFVYRNGVWHKDSRGWKASQVDKSISRNDWKELSEEQARLFAPKFFTEQFPDPFDFVEPKPRTPFVLDEFERQTVLWLILQAGRGEPKAEALAEKIRNHDSR